MNSREAFNNALDAMREAEAEWVREGGDEARYHADLPDEYYPLCAKCGEPLSLPMPGFEDQTVTDAYYCVECRPEETKQLNLKLEAEK